MRHYLLLACCCLSAPVYGECFLATKSTEIGFINGIFNTFDGATASALILQNATQVPVSLLYNHTLYPLDLLEASQQLKIDNIVTAPKHLLPSQYKKLVTGLEWVTRGMTSYDYKVHSKAVNTLLDRSNRVVIVAHSQGNLFANKAYDSINDKSRRDRLTLIHVAPPGGEIRGETYYLSSDDMVINTVNSTLVLDGLKPNIPPPAHPVKNAVSGHEFVDTYMDRSSKSFLGITSQIRKIKSESPSINGRTGITGEYQWDTWIYYKALIEPQYQSGKVSLKSGVGTWETDSGTCHGTVKVINGEFYSTAIKSGGCFTVNGKFTPSQLAHYPNRFEREFDHADLANEVPNPTRDVFMERSYGGRMVMKCIDDQTFDFF